jgi:hypothetical protein
MSRVVDYAWGRPSIAALQAAGAVAVCRYLSYDATGKNLSAIEAAVLTLSGVDVVSNWEYGGNWSEYSGGFAAGVRHATEANRQHLACGGPPSRPIYFSTDFDPASSQFPVIANYYHGVASVIGLDRTGAYGGYPTIKYLFDAGVIAWGWQTYAWSGSPTRWDSRAQLRQVQNGVRIDGVDCDLNDSWADDFGQWGAINMEQGDTVQAWNGQARQISLGWIWGDQGNLQDWWRVAPTETSISPPKAGSRLDLLMRAVARINAAAELVELTRKSDQILAMLTALSTGGVDVVALAAQIVVGVVAAHDSLTEADKPVIEAAVLDALRAGTRT